MANAEDFLSAPQRESVAQAIAQAERITSGEIRVHIEEHIEEDPLQHAAFVFHELGMQHTRERNGVLLFVSVADRLVAVFGDQGINDKVPQGFWDSTVALLKQHFAEGRQAEGLCEAVRVIGEKLASFFPPRSDDKNELSNEVTFGGR